MTLIFKEGFCDKRPQKMPKIWYLGEVEKRGGVWGYFVTHIPTGRQRFEARNWRTKKEAEAWRAQEDERLGL